MMLKRNNILTDNNTFINNSMVKTGKEMKMLQALKDKMVDMNFVSPCFVIIKG